MNYSRISIVIPSYNQAHYIQNCIQSIRNSRYPNLEIIIVDGASQDGTIDILKKEKGLLWISEKDHGQADALNKGLLIATGEIIGWMNCDDFYNPETFFMVNEQFRKNPEKKWLCGKCRIVDAQGKEIRRWITGYKNFWLLRYSYSTLLSENYISTPAVFFKNDIVKEIGPMDTRYGSLAFDYDFWLRIGKRYQPLIVNEYLSNWRWYESSTSGKNFDKIFKTELEIARQYAGGRKIVYAIHFFNCYKIIFIYKLMAFFRSFLKY